MPTFREMIRPILAITIAAAILMLLLAQLDATTWADGFRVGVTNEGFEGDTRSGIVAIIGPLIKIALLMGLPALLTLGVRNLIGRLRKSETNHKPD